MILIIGLGNPGDKFKNTRHNIGFMTLDFFAKKNDFPDFELSKKYGSLVSEKNNIILAKPQTFMNESGKAVKKLKSKNTDLVVIHDDIDLSLGKIKIVENRGSAGHKGVESIIKNIGNKGLVRFRVGVQPPRGKPSNPENFVVKNLTSEEQDTINKTIKKTSDALVFLIENGLEKTMSKYNAP